MKAKIAWFLVMLGFSACASRLTTTVNAGGAQALLESSAKFNSISVVDIESRDTVYRLSRTEVDSFKSALKASFVSESLLLTPPPWPIALVLGAGNGPIFVVLHYGDVLRVNSGSPWSTNIADSEDNVPIKGLADIVLGGDDVPWLNSLLQRVVGKPPAKSHTVSDMPQLLDPL